MVDSLYIHIPFCRKKCPYCDFFSIGYEPEIASSYIEALCSQIKALNKGFKTIYVGGGTPTVLTPKQLQKLLKVLSSKRDLRCEFTVEANPESLSPAKLRIISREGVNRISLGFQSLNEGKLKKLNRIHSAELAKAAVYQAKKSGIENISIDLIFGLWQENFSDWQTDLEGAIKLPVKHISLYSLSYEKGTPLFRAKLSKKIKPLDDARVAKMYRYTLEFLAAKGFQQYEISNFSRKGYECKHSLNYWDNSQYLGLGSSAVSYLGGVRTKNISHVFGYIDRVKSKTSPLISRDKLSLLKRAKETAALKIRTKKGIDFNWFKQKTGFDFLSLEKEALEELRTKGLIIEHTKKRIPQSISLTNKGFLFCDTVSSIFL